VANPRLYRLTPAGQTAWQREDARVPLELRRVLGLFQSEMHADTLRARLVRFSEAEILEILEYLVEQGLLEASDAKERHDLDFTTDLDLTGLRKTAG
jgi:hypothetical protein